eukprot:CAMPEP_0116873428 /NCGR_PEP_ID=MMETSP0463-20121206/4534_1 /TAXON_ID=181622 /ORGANISM="Strombidinopsis sp, Strain SopsisLIS2011" /LENGTH=41 /DNA_ID= /DNA_START= /DNA_END= /DNA_ORIENTATION=
MKQTRSSFDEQELDDNSNYIMPTALKIQLDSLKFRISGKLT